LNLAESTLEGLPQEDRQVVVLSDLATEKELELPDIARVPLAELTTPLENCAISRASRQEESVVVEVGCTSPAAALERSVELIDDKGTILAKMPLSEVVTLAPKGGPAPRSATVRLTPARSDRDDQIPEDDRSHLLPSGGGLVVGVRADEDRSGLRTSSSTVLDTALSALGTKARVQPLTLIPSRAADLATYAAILIDDPPGFTPETAEALEEYAEQGGVIAAFLGPRLKNAPLGSTFRPLLENPPSWSPSGELSVDPRAEQGLGPLTEGWSDLVPTGRAIIGPASSDARVLARFVGGQPLLLERGLGRGLLLVGALPTSLEESDFALRPAFLALLDRVVHQAGVRNGSAATECGTPWELPDDTTVRGPDGAVEVRHVGGNVLVEPDVAGRYLLRRDGTETERYAVINPQENLLQPRIPVHDEVSRAMTSTSQKTDISREVALGVLLLAAAELAFRLFLGRKRRTRGPLRRELA
jgi:hypothetical protein